MGIYSMGRFLLIILTDKCITDKCIIDVIWVLCLYIKKTCNGPKSLFAIIQVKLGFFLVALLYCLTSTNYYETYFQKILTLFLFNHNHIIYITNMYILHTVSLHFYQQITNVLLFYLNPNSCKHMHVTNIVCYIVEINVPEHVSRVF